MTEHAVPIITGAIAVAFLHTVSGPDHYIPFIAIARARNWSLKRTLLVTLMCGVGHVSSSIILGVLGATIGWAASDLKVIQEHTGLIAGWSLIILGALWAIWGLFRGRALSSKSHHMLHELAESEKKSESISVWILFIIFVLGPCEPLIAYTFPLGLAKDIAGLVQVSVAFSAVTVATMMSVVGLAYLGLVRLRGEFMERYSHALAGFAIFMSGAAITWFGL